jgi:TonB-linked SusC/RagA family outer membrane protein
MYYTKKLLALALILFLGFPHLIDAEINETVVQQAREKKVTLRIKNGSIRNVLTEIEKQTGIGFALDNSKVEFDVPNISISVKNVSVDDALKMALENTNYSYRMVEGHIVITPKVVRSASVRLNAENTITGRVTDEDNQPLVGANIYVREQVLRVTTDKDGYYSLPLPDLEQFSLLFSFVGMQTKEIKYAGKNTIDVVLKETVSILAEVVVNTGYQNIDLRKTTSAIQSIKAEDIVVPGLTSIDQMLEGYVPGMTFMQNSGQIGAVPRLRIRGTSTVLGNQEPLWVINGIVQENPININPEQINDLDFVNLLGNAVSGLNPDDVEQIDILKDASATALYGARAANGVIVVTTKQGKPGPPAISYSFSGTYRQRPYYSDASVNMMNSRERIDFSRELIEKQVTYPLLTNGWVGYEKAMRDYWLGRISFGEMQSEVSRYESVNTDWFDVLMQNTLSNKHTVGLSGGTTGLRYYISAGYTEDKGNIKGEDNKSYTGNVNLTANYNRFTIHFNMSGNSGKKVYTPSDVELTKYAYETTRALPAYNDDGSLWYYQRQVSSELSANALINRDFNIINDKDNTSQDIRNAGFKGSVVVDYKISNPLKASITASYATDNTTQEIWHGEKSLEAMRLAYTANATQGSVLPAGGELKYQNSEHYAYTVRGQVDFNKHFDSEKKHFVSATAGGEVSSNQYYGLSQTYRGYLKERGKKMAEIALNTTSYTNWKATNPDALGAWTDKLTNMASAYGTLSYTFNNVYTVNGNVRLDASNRFGSRANEKLAPIWSFSARWHIKEDILKEVRWINDLSLRGSFGYQGNMLENQTSKLVLQRGTLNAIYQDYVSSIYQGSYPNPDLRWEKTASYNASLDFAVLQSRVAGSISYFYKKTEDAFLSKTVSSINGLDRYVVNQGTLENQGLELGLQFTVIDTKKNNPNGVRWSMSPNVGQTLNKLFGNSKDKALTNQITYQNLLDGTLEMEGRPLNSFYSYKYLGLNANNGIPIFYGSQQNQGLGYQTINFVDKYRNMDLIDIFTDVMEYSGTRVPTIQGGVQNSVSWKQFSATMSVTYSFGSKIRLLQMYPTANTTMVSIAPQPTVNVRREFLDRWRIPGDEKYTNVPGIVSLTDYTQTIGSQLWWSGQRNSKNEAYSFASSLWQMYDQSNLRVVNGDFVKIQSLSVRYNIPDKFCKSATIKSAYIGLTGTNLFTFCSDKLKGQDPATQDGVAPTINMSLRPTYSFSLNVSF